MLNKIIAVYSIVDDLLKAIRHDESELSYNSPPLFKHPLIQDLRNWHIFLKTVTRIVFGYNVYKSILTSIYLNLKYMCQLTLYCDACVSPVIIW